MKFCIIRLGKDSIHEIKIIDSLVGIQSPPVKVTIHCRQIPSEVNQDTYCLIWLGSDNNKGAPTTWEQGLRALGKVLSKKGGPNYNDDWEITFELGIIFPNSIKHVDILERASEEYKRFSDIPIIGINTHSNQTVQLIKLYAPRQNIKSLFYTLNVIQRNLYEQIKQTYSDLIDLIEDQNQINLFEINESTNNEKQQISNETIDVVEKEGVDPTIGLMERPFNPSLINIENKLLNIDLIIKRLNRVEPEIDLYPDFQRKDDLWDDTKQSRLIESILIRFPLPAFYFDGSDKNKWLVVDGLQRLSSIRNFVIKKSLKLTNLEFLTKLNGFYYNDLDRDLQRIIEETQVVAYIINPGTPDDVKFNIFKRINTGGLVLEAQEIRHALYQGPSKFIGDLANSEEFKEATSYSINTQRMLDRDFVNRFLCFYLFGYENYVPDLDSFMSRALNAVNSLSPELKDTCKTDFLKSMRLNYEIFGSYAFRKIMEIGERRKPLNKALFDVFSVVFSKLNDSERVILVNKKNEVKQGLVNLLTNDETFFWSVSTSTSDRNRVNYRFKKTEELINHLLST